MTRTRWAVLAALIILAILLAFWLSGWTWDDRAQAADHPTLTVTAIHVGDEFIVAGCGYRTGGREVYIYLYDSTDTLLLTGAHFLDPDGCFTWATGYTFATAGGYEAYSFLTKGTTGVGSYNHNHPLVDLDFTIS